MVYKEKEERKKAITSLGIFTVLSLLISAFVVVPAYLQIAESYRVSFKLSVILNSKLGSITDKLIILMYGGILYTGIIFLLLRYKKHKQFLKFYIPCLVLLLMPIIIEPIHKMLMFGSYACFPYRFGFIMVFLLVLGAAYAFNNYEKPKFKSFKFNNVFLCINIRNNVYFLILIYIFNGI